MKNLNDNDPQQLQTPKREYEKSGMYPAEGKPFRLYALLGWLSAVILLLAGAALILNFTLLDMP